MELAESWKEAMLKIPLSLPIAVLSGAALVGLTSLTLYHLKLNLYNQTTFESAKNTFEGFEWPAFETESKCKNLRYGIAVKSPKKALFKPKNNAYKEGGEGTVSVGMNEYKSPTDKTP